MELSDDLNIDGFDQGNGAALINHRRYANRCVLREGRKDWICRYRGRESGEQRTYDYGNHSYARRTRPREQSNWH